MTIASDAVTVTVGAFTTATLAYARDVTVAGSLAGLSGNYGRFSLGARLAAIPGLTDATAALAQASAAAALLAQVATDVTALAGPATAGGQPALVLALASQFMVEGLRCCAVDPADGVRVLIQLLYAPLGPQSADPAAAAAQYAAATMLGRCVLTSLARACAAYRPVSSTEALALLSQVTALFDAAIVNAADRGERQAYAALRALRSAVAADLTARGADLPSLVTLSTPQSEPSLVLAMRFYGDAYREPGLVARAGAVHPLFMPVAFEALAP